ncbi:hypothetical protein [Haloterrigena turkmenica]|uniref:hypothetical protein n=1 Tax=Haloterrigena turkmenica TaxID=62320 RepID=UPI0009D6CE3B|nr:hypothetical protein [Haloterrigena turkmenica]
MSAQNRRNARSVASCPRSVIVVYRPHERSGCTIVTDKMCKASSLPLLRWHGDGDHRGTEQAKIPIGDVF